MTSSRDDLRRFGLFERPYGSWISAGFTQVLLFFYFSQGHAWAFPDLLGPESTTLDLMTRSGGLGGWFMGLAMPTLALGHLVCCIGLIRNHDGWFGVQSATTVMIASCFFFLGLFGTQFESGSAVIIEFSLAFNFLIMAAAAPADHFNKMRVEKRRQEPTAS